MGALLSCFAADLLSLEKLNRVRLLVILYEVLVGLYITSFGPSLDDAVEIAVPHCNRELKLRTDLAGS
jgi:hypothetical protein